MDVDANLTIFAIFDDTDIRWSLNHYDHKCSRNKALLINSIALFKPNELCEQLEKSEEGLSSGLKLNPDCGSACYKNFIGE